MSKIKKKDGQEFRVRGSNKKYLQLDDLDHLKELLRINCPADVAKLLEVPANSVMFTIDRYFTEEEKDNIAWKRKRHKNNLTTK